MFRDRFVGRTVSASSPQGRFAEGAAALDGARLDDAEAWGKQMWLRFDGPVWLRVHLGLYGMWRFAGPGLAGFGRRSRAPETDDWPPPPRGLVRLRLLAGDRVADLSGPTACGLETADERAVSMARLGEDPLRDDADPDRAFARVHASRSAIGLLLMRQDLVAGIGNIYRAEILFRAKIEPHRPGRDITAGQWRALWDDLRTLMQAGVRTGRIVTTGKTGKAPVKRGAANYVSHRAGQPCRVCGTIVLSEDMAGRTLYWCPICQR